MNLDNCYIEPLLHDWLEELRITTKAHEDLVNAKDEFYMPFIAVPVSIINAIFKITEHLQLGVNTKYIAIHLYDRFMCNYFWKKYKNSNKTEIAWSQLCKRISSRSKLYLMSCLQLASKMDSHLKHLKIAQILHTLQWIDKKTEYTHNLLLLSEYKVLKTVNFKMPFYTPINCIEVLLAATGLNNNENMQELTIHLLDLVYLQRGQLYSHFQCLSQGHTVKTFPGRRKLMIMQSNALLLGASIVLCGTFFICIDSVTAKAIASRLSELIEIKVSDIWNMANILLVMAIQE